MASTKARSPSPKSACFTNSLTAPSPPPRAWPAISVLDAGYLSRILRRFSEQGLLDRETSKTDGRQSFLHLSRKGRAAFAPLEERSHAEVKEMLNKLPTAGQAALVEAMRTVERLLSPNPSEISKTSYILRPHQPGDMGWVVHRHGALYAQNTAMTNVLRRSSPKSLRTSSSTWIPNASAAGLRKKKAKSLARSFW